ncbi:MAG: hypothetical protein CMJ23_04895 [Phycisphaerae bacterium]|nr:hypothetical protein [Phycisphaerae bacterium]
MERLHVDQGLRAEFHPFDVEPHRIGNLRQDGPGTHADPHREGIDRTVPPHEGRVLGKQPHAVGLQHSQGHGRLPSGAGK